MDSNEVFKNIDSNNYNNETRAERLNIAIATFCPKIRCSSVLIKAKLDTL